MAKKTTLTATMPDGTTVTRTTAREYKYVIYYKTGSGEYRDRSWVSRPDLRDKELSKFKNCDRSTYGYAEVN